MRKLPKSKLRELATIFILANTPNSLAKGMLRSDAVDILRKECTEAELLEYYNQVTTKGNRSPFVAALAYATLIALLAKKPTQDQYPDPACLQWGKEIASYMTDNFGRTESLIITADAPRPLIITPGNKAWPDANQQIARINRNSSLIS